MCEVVPVDEENEFTVNKVSYKRSFFVETSVGEK
jgi:hypothetical protein